MSERRNTVQKHVKTKRPFAIEGRTNIWAQPISGGPPRKLTDFKTDWLMRFDWSRDRKQLLCVRGRLTSDLFEISSSSNSK